MPGVPGVGGAPSLIGPECVSFIDVSERPPDACLTGPGGRTFCAVSVIASLLSESICMWGGCARGDDVFGTFDMMQRK